MKRFLAMFAALPLLLISLGGPMAAAHSATPVPSSPTALTQQFFGHTLAAGGWTRSNTLKISVSEMGTGGWLHAEVQVGLVGSSFAPLLSGRGPGVQIPNGYPGTLTAKVSGLAGNKSYAWQVRVVNAMGEASAWASFTAAGSAAFRTDFTPPSTPAIVSDSGLIRGHWSRAATATFSWSSQDAGSGIAGYSYSFCNKLHAPRPPMTSATSATASKLADGHWFLHVWARDNAGNWSALGDFPFNINRTAPKIQFDTVTTSTFDPYFGQEKWTFLLKRKAAVSLQVDRTGKWTVLNLSLGTLKPGLHTYVWNGKGHEGHIVPSGWYWIRIETKDKLGNTGSFASPGIHVNAVRLLYPYYPEPGRHIVVSLSKEAIYAYDGTHLVTWSLATTGNPALPTPTGHFTIFARFTPFEFVSPWPPGSPYYYAPSWVTYAMEFQGAGYFIHDAPWRSVFGPGSNGPGTPGTNYGGSHGCVNVPFSMAQFLWNWSTIGTPVDVIN